MQSSDAVYQTLPSAVEHSADPVRHRPPRQNSNRLTNIVSMYIPALRLNEQSQTNYFSTERDQLLSGTESYVDYQQESFCPLYDIKLLFDGEKLVKKIVDGIGTATMSLSGQTRRITAIAADAHTVYIALEELPYIFLLNPNSTLENASAVEMDDLMVKGYVQLHISQVGDLVPKEISVYSPKPESTVLYVVGWIKVVIDSQRYVTERKWMLAKFALNGNYLARTPLHSYERYSGIAVDTRDGQLLLTCPHFVNVNSLSNKEVPFNTEVAAGQLCKLTNGFERRVFSITMGNDSATYRPDYVAQESAGRCCWASVERHHRCSSPASNTDDTQTRRLFAFPGRQPEGEDRRSPRDWLHVVSWDFAELTPGRIAAFDANRLLVIDHQIGTLSYVTWDENQETPTLHRITRPGTKPIRLLCSNYNASLHSVSDYKPTAYFVAGSSIYSFSFRESR